MKLDSLIDQFADDLSFDSLENWASILNVPYEPDMCGHDDFIEWEDELRMSIGEAMKKVGK